MIKLRIAFRLLAATGLTAMLAACQTPQFAGLGSSTSSSSPTTNSGSSGKNLLPAAAFVAPSGDSAAPPKNSGSRRQPRTGGSGDAKESRTLSKDGKINSETYAETMRTIHPELARSSHTLVVARGMMRTCKNEEVMKTSGMTEFFDNLDELLKDVYRRAYAMEAKRLETEGKKQMFAIIGMLLTQDSALNARKMLIDSTRKPELNSEPHVRNMNDDQRLRLSCTLLARPAERKSIVRNIATPLLEYFVMMRAGHPKVYERVNRDDDPIGGIRSLAEV